MMHIKTKPMLITALILVFIAFIGNVWINKFLKGFRAQLERVLSDNLNMDVRIYSLEAGIVAGTVLNHVKLHGAVVEAKKVVIGLRPWDFLLGRVFQVKKIKIIDPVLRVGPEWSAFIGNLSTNVGMLPQRLNILITNGIITFGSADLPLASISGEVRFRKNEIFLKKIKGVLFGMPVVISGSINRKTGRPWANIDTVIEAPKLTYRGRLYGEFPNPSLEGTMTVMDKLPLTISGDIAVKNETLFIDKFCFGKKSRLDALQKADASAGNITLSFPRNTPQKEALGIRLENVDIFGSEVSSYIECSARQPHERKDIWSGEIMTFGTVLNKQPFYETEFSYGISSDTLEIIYLKLGNNMRCSGKVSFAKPYIADVVFKFEDASLAELMGLASGSNSRSAEEFASGKVSGHIKIQGPFTSPYIKMNLSARDGHIGDLSFDTLNINAQGHGGIIYIVDSRATQKNNILLLEGDIELA
ncbi:MAG: hypothetical protein ABIH01_02000, partial [Candidatus Omnitrophota bacterium]